MPRYDFSSVDRFSALAALGQARVLEWMAVATQALLMEGAARRQEWQEVERGLQALGWDTGAMADLPQFAAAAAHWGQWCIRQQLALSQALFAAISFEALGLSVSGRREGLNPGRRRSAVVIDFPDRRRNASPDPSPEPMG